MLHLTPDQTAWLLAALLTLIAAPFLMALVPRCNHPACREAHKEAKQAELRALVVAERERIHAFHSWDRPQKSCSLCQAICPTCKGRGVCNPECECARCAA